MENERCFFILTFMKSKVRNKLTTHLPIVAPTCLHNGFIFCKLSHMQNALNNREWVAHHQYCYDGEGVL
jgi:hypothetical protein